MVRNKVMGIVVEIYNDNEKRFYEKATKYLDSKKSNPITFTKIILNLYKIFIITHINSLKVCVIILIRKELLTLWN